MKKQVKRILFAGTGSGSGKTTLTCGILQCLLRRGMIPSAFKCGPDYIDPMFHRQVLQVPSGNLDSFFCDRNTLRYLLAENTKEDSIAVIEGAMGYYDGIGMSKRASSAEIARITETPAILILNGRGMAISIEAMLYGYAMFGGECGRQIKGVIFNMIAESLYKEAAAFARELGLIPLGYVPQKEAITLKSRHLGLVLPKEVEDLQKKMTVLADTLEETVDIEGILSLAESAPPMYYSDVWRKVERLLEPVRVGVAMDEAFCFLYRDNIEFLRRAGCEIVYFSPLRDKGLPKNMDLLLLCGGYPELYAKELSENIGMRKAVWRWMAEKKPCIAECGGFLYLHEELEDEEGKSYPMVGALAGKGIGNQKLQNFGYIELKAQSDSILCRKDEKLRAHEFHYWSCEDNGKTFIAQKASNKKSWETGVADQRMYAGFPHFYYYGEQRKIMEALQSLVCGHREINS